MAQSVTTGEQVNEMSFELLKNTQQIAEQAAMRAKEIQLKFSKGPEIPMRGSADAQKAPEIPPKRLSLKKIPDENGTSIIEQHAPIPIPQRNLFQKQPPPIPQKPASAQNSPRPKDKTPHPIQGIQPFQKPIIHDGAPPLSQVNKNQNIVNILNSPLFQQRAYQFKQQQSSLVKNTQKTDEDFGSEDALRGIERGLKNMERAMKEQMTNRNMDFVDEPKNSEKQFNPMEFKRSLGSSVNSLDNSNQHIRMVGQMRLNFDNQQLGRAIERNMSMDQMQLMQGGGPIKSISKDFSQQQQPKHNIYRSLDRSLPLELQYSRHRQQQEMEFMRQNNQPINNQRQQQQQQTTQGLSREDLNMRRRSSHDETQYIIQHQQQKPNNTNTNNNNDNPAPGKLICSSIELNIIYSYSDFYFLVSLHLNEITIVFHTHNLNFCLFGSKVC